MTQKRFYVDKSGDFNDKQTGNIIVDFGYSFNAMECKMILDLLNDLNNENEQLKKENQRLEKQRNVLINYMDNWCPKRFYDVIIKRMEEVE